MQGRSRSCKVVATRRSSFQWIQRAAKDLSETSSTPKWNLISFDFEWRRLRKWRRRRTDTPQAQPKCEMWNETPFNGEEAAKKKKKERKRKKKKKDEIIFEKNKNQIKTTNRNGTENMETKTRGHTHTEKKRFNQSLFIYLIVMGNVTGRHSVSTGY